MDPFGLKVIFITVLVFMPLERLFAMHPQKVFRRNWGNDLIFLLLNGMLIKLGLLAVIVAVIFAAAWIVPASFQAMVGGLPYWVQIPAVIVLSDLGFYWTHRMFHAVPWLWRFHSIHHSIEELDWLAAAQGPSGRSDFDQGGLAGTGLRAGFLRMGNWRLCLALSVAVGSHSLQCSRWDLVRCASCLLRRNFITGIIVTTVRPGTGISPGSCPSWMRCSGAFICREGKCRRPTVWIGRCRNATCLSCFIPSSARSGSSSPNRTQRRWLRRCGPQRRRPIVRPDKPRLAVGALA